MSEGATSSGASPDGARRGFWRRVLHRLTAEDSELDAESLAIEAGTEGAKQSCFCQRGEGATGAGRVRGGGDVPRGPGPPGQAGPFERTRAGRLGGGRA